MSTLVVIKYGGAAMTDATSGARFAREVAALPAAGFTPVVVHGGGKELTALLARLGIESRFEDGHRVTSREAAEAAAMVLSGQVNQRLVGDLNRAGLRAFGLSGSDGGLLRTRRHRPGGHDLGHVGRVESVDPDPLLLLIEAGYVPVVSSTAAGDDGEPLNINADLVAGSVAAALGARVLLFLSDVPGVLAGGPRSSGSGDTAVVPALTLDQARRLLAAGTAAGGMRPKLEAAVSALEAGVERVVIADGRGQVDLQAALAGRAAGTVLGGAVAPTLPDWAGTLAARGEKAVMATYARYPIEVASARGCEVVGSDGRTYLDFASGVAVSALGHAHPALVRAIRRGAPGLVHVSNLYWTEPMLRLAERLTAAAGMDRAFFCNSGAEAVETAIKLARKARPGRERLVVLDRSFHGRTMGALSATMQPRYQDPFVPLLPGVVRLPFGDLAAAAAAIDEGVAAVLVEPIQGEGGMRPLPPGYLAHLREQCNRSGALLILDEVQTGIGRTGELFACQGEGVVPDALCAAKALAGGLPMGVLLARGEAARAFVPGDHGSTFGGGPLVSDVAHAVLDVVLAPGFLATVRERGARLGAALEASARRHPGQVLEARGRGLMWGLALHQPDAPRLVAELHALGLLTVPAGPDVLRLMPPLIVTESEIDRAVASIDAALDRIAAPSPATATATA